MLDEIYIEEIGFSIGFIGSFITLIIMDNFFLFGLDKKNKVQKIHEINSYRIGGILIILLLLFTTYIFDLFLKFPLFFLCFIPLIIVAAIEDVFQNVSIKARLLSMTITSFLLVYYTGSVLNEVEINFLNHILDFRVIAIFVTIIGIVVTCNAWNFIDGLNGISSGIGSFVLFIFSVICGDIYIDGFREFLVLLSFITLGLCVTNLLTGKIFLGDTGSYFLGAIIGWSGVLIVNENSNVSPWSIFLIIIYPAIEITFSIFRRTLQKKSPFKPDNLHLHSLLYSILIKNFKIDHTILNSLSGVLIIIFGILPGIYCFHIDGSFPATITAVIVYIIIYLLAYFLLLLLNSKKI